MPAPKTLSYKLALRTLRGHLVFTLGPLRLYPITKDPVPIFEGFLTRWGEVHAMEIALADAIDLAQNAVLRADIGLNAFATKIAKTIAEIAGEQHKAELMAIFFKKKTVSDFKRPILGGQYRAMTVWPKALEDSIHDELKALRSELVPLLAAAAKAIEDKDNAKLAKKVFRDVGERRKFFDEVNAARKALYGELSSLPHKTPGLPSDFADQFFRRDAAADVEEEDDEEEEEPTLESVGKRIEELEAELEAQRALHKQLDEAAKLEAARVEKIRSDEEKLAALEREAEDKQKEADALRARLAEQKEQKQ
jgi:hypothetical protein